MRVDTDEPEIIERIAALDVGKAEVVCSARVPGPSRRTARGDRPSLAARGARLRRRLPVAVGPVRIDQHGGAPLLGHDSVVFLPVLVPAAGRGEHRAQQ